MKIEKIKFNNHWLFGNLEINFKDKQGNILDTIVIIGENGSGKTTLLDTIESAILDNELIFVSDGKYKVKTESYEVELNMKDKNDGWVYYSDLNSLNQTSMDDTIILIDMPETGLHPKLQKKIIKTCKNIGKNNQLIIATHSPFVIGDVKSKQIISLKKTEEDIKVINNKNLSETYGKTVDDILSAVMGLSSTRNEDVEDKLDKIYDLLNKGLYKTEEFNNIFGYLKSYLGDLDKDIMRIRMEISIRQKG